MKKVEGATKQEAVDKKTVLHRIVAEKNAVLKNTMTLCEIMIENPVSLGARRPKDKEKKFKICGGCQYQSLRTAINLNTQTCLYVHGK